MYLLNMFATDDKVLIFALGVDKEWGARQRLASVIAADVGRVEHFWLAVWLLSTCYISFAYVYNVYDITNENEMFYFMLPQPVYCIL